MELETVNKLYLEFSQFATAKTKNDLLLEEMKLKAIRRGKLLTEIFNSDEIELTPEFISRINEELFTK